MKKLLSVLLAALLLLGAVPAVSAAGAPAPAIMLDAQRLSYAAADAEPVLSAAGRTMVPLAATVRAMFPQGATVSTVHDTATVQAGGVELVFQQGEDAMLRNGVSVPLEGGAPYLENGELMVPVRPLAEGLGLFVGWSSEGGSPTVTLYHNPGATDAERSAANFIFSLLGNPYAAGGYELDDAMSALFSSPNGGVLIDSLFQGAGQFAQLAAPYSFSMQGYEMAVLPTRFTAGAANICVTVDTAGKIAGIQLLPYGETVPAVMPEGVSESELNFTAADSKVFSGTMTKPDGEGKFPCVVLVHGSGMNDRDETAGPNKPFRDVAWGLAERGIAVYRYDKRTYLYPNESSLDETFDMEKETTLDAVDAVNMVAQLPYVDTENIVVLGHSQGGYKIPAIAEKADQADKFIIMSGPARSLPDLMVEQYTFLTTVNGVQTEQGKQMVAALKADIAKLTDDSVPDSEILPMLGARKYYWKQTLGYDPIEVSKSITEPVLVTQGERDYQVTMEDFALWKAAHADDANWNFLSYPKMNHMQADGEGPMNNLEYLVPHRVKEQLLDDYAAFIKG
ncbi:alpha/beta hydrolase family protein [Feifania hominis]|uniref:Alpha/beta fold hydrolase n=1 Tax=Feifania hominis TaxID=2763660 RepID=A0A926DFH0_9FIRM|nr:alpha/beta fold hydrolase [Feifania hominis]MBC8536872.1 alpha/beta fold hydrolase [Feifania hominis]